VQKGIEGLVHISEISWTDRISDLHKNFKVGQQIDVTVVSLDKENRRMSLSVKQLQKNPWESMSEQFKVGQKIKGTISNITDFGIFVQIMPGIDGLVHISDLSWTEHIEHPSDMYSKGQEVEAVVLNIDEQSKKVSLGIKQLSQDPWTAIREQYPVGTIVDGKGLFSAAFDFLKYRISRSIGKMKKNFWQFAVFFEDNRRYNWFATTSYGSKTPT
jgi:small subunit ribosomal protein S1